MAYKSQKTLYLGLDPSRFQTNNTVVHFPIIEIRPIAFELLTTQFDKMDQYTHIICTSRTVASLLFKYGSFKNQRFLAIGKSTARLLKENGIHNIVVAQEEKAEGVISILNEVVFENSYVFYPHSELSRPVIQNFLEKKHIKHESCVLYQTITNKKMPPPNLAEYTYVIFTSPSTVNAFYELYGQFPKHLTLQAIGPITLQHLNYLLGKNSSSPMVGE